MLRSSNTFIFEFISADYKLFKTNHSNLSKLFRFLFVILDITHYICRIKSNKDTDMAHNDYIIPTKEHPVFVAQNMYSGYFIDSEWKDWQVKNDEKWCVGETTSMNLLGAIRAVYDHIKENTEYLSPETKFQIDMIDGSYDKYGDPVRVKCYSISVKQAKKFRII